MILSPQNFPDNLPAALKALQQNSKASPVEVMQRRLYTSPAAGFAVSD